MQTQPFNPEEDMADIKRWWAEHEQPVELEDVLSSRGLIIPGVCAAWLYLSDGPLAWIGWPVGNPDASPRDVHDGLEKIFDELLDDAKANGARVVGATTAITGLVKVFERAGFTVTDRSTTSLYAGV